MPHLMVSRLLSYLFVQAVGMSQRSLAKDPILPTNDDTTIRLRVNIYHRLSEDGTHRFCHIWSTEVGSALVRFFPALLFFSAFCQG
jgi:hypothetical protein